jgi:hypothetical protein
MVFQPNYDIVAYPLILCNPCLAMLSLKFRPHMATRTQHRQTVMKSFMALN